MRIVLVISSLGPGGAERVAVQLAQGFAERRHQVTVLTLNPTVPDFYALAPGIDRVRVDLVGSSPSPVSGLVANLTRLRRLRQAVRTIAADVAIAFMTHTNVLTVLAAWGTPTRVIATEHIDPHHYSPGRPWAFLRRLTYPFAARLVSVSAGTDRGFAWLNVHKRAVIHNPVSFPSCPAPPQTPQDRLPTVVSLGRLVYQKGFDLLIDAFAQVHPSHPMWRLVIAGEGADRPLLEQRIRQRGLTGLVELPGLVQDVEAFLRGGMLFVLPSRFEGFGNVLVEAMSCALPVIAADCPSGPREILAGGEFGLLVPPQNTDALAVALDHLMGDDLERARLAERALAGAQPYALDRIIDQWERLLHTLVRR